MYANNKPVIGTYSRGEKVQELIYSRECLATTVQNVGELSRTQIESFNT